MAAKLYVLPEGVDLDAMIHMHLRQCGFLEMDLAAFPDAADARRLAQRRATILALRVLKIVAQPSDEQAEKVGLKSEMAHDVAAPYPAMLAGKARAGLAAILDMAKENPDAR
jgi:hypothetical protein